MKKAMSPTMWVVAMIIALLVLGGSLVFIPKITHGNNLIYFIGCKAVKTDFFCDKVELPDDDDPDKPDPVDPYKEISDMVQDKNKVTEFIFNDDDMKTIISGLTCIGLYNEGEGFHLLKTHVNGKPLYLAHRDNYLKIVRATFDRPATKSDLLTIDRMLPAGDADRLQLERKINLAEIYIGVAIEQCKGDPDDIWKDVCDTFEFERFLEVEARCGEK